MKQYKELIKEEKWIRDKHSFKFIGKFILILIIIIFIISIPFYIKEKRKYEEIIEKPCDDYFGKGNWDFIQYYDKTKSTRAIRTCVTIDTNLTWEQTKNRGGMDGLFQLKWIPPDESKLNLVK